MTRTIPATPEKKRSVRASTVNGSGLPSSVTTWIVDGLGPYNPSLSLARQAFLVEWFSHYTEVTRTDFCILYRLSQ